MSTTSGPRAGGRPRVAAHESKTTNVSRDYHDHSYHDNRTEIILKSCIAPLDRLLGHVAHGALHDSAERGPDAPKCHPETRIAVQGDIMSWIRHGERDKVPRRILWLSGPAGSGKTAIAGTVANECYKNGLLAASFFFSAFAGSIERRLSKPLIPTLVYRLIQHKAIVGFKEAVLTVIEDDPGVFGRHLDQQVEELVLKPLRKVAGRSDHKDWPSIIIIDGLDECQGDRKSSGSEGQKAILSTLSRISADPTFRFRFIIASRPEPVIRHFFSTSPVPALDIFLDDKYDPDSDIRLFLNAMFNDIRRRFNLPSSWAPENIIDLLVKEASGQFIYAATVIRFLDNPRLGPPQQQLTRVLQWRDLDDSKPFEPLDALYSRILHTSPQGLLAARWLRFIDDQQTLRRVGSSYIKNILESYPGEAEHVLGSLTSLIRVANEQGEPEFHFYHKSLLDFLGDPHRSSDLHVNEESLIDFMEERYYQVLRARGPQSNFNPQLKNPLASDDFLQKFCLHLERYIDSRRRYTSRDVEWWLANLLEGDQVVEIPKLFTSIHWPCKWYRCLPACGVWREGILRYCRQHGWPVPKATKLLRSRFKKHQYHEFNDCFFPDTCAKNGGHHHCAI